MNHEDEGEIRVVVQGNQGSERGIRVAMGNQGDQGGNQCGKGRIGEMKGNQCDERGGNQGVKVYFVYLFM